MSFQAPQERIAHFYSPISSVTIAIAWTVLLKDYLASPVISFFFSNSTLSPRLVDLVLDENETLDQLRARLEHQISLHPSARLKSSQSLFSSHLYVSTGRFDQSPAEKKSSADVTTDANSPLGDTRVDLKVQCTVLDDGQSVRLKRLSDCAAVSSDQVARILTQLEAVLERVHLPAHGNELVYSIPTTSNLDMSEIWKRNLRVQKACDKPLLEHFLDHAQHTPDALAVDAWDGSLTYQELDQLSTSLSERLAQLGIQRGHILPLCFEKCMWTPVAVLAVLKTGAAFFLLDEQLPLERMKQLAGIISPDIQVAISSASQQHRARMLASTVVTVDSRLRSDILTHACVAAINVNPSDLAYIVFTSGTTGVPKAATIRQSNVCAFVQSVGRLSAVNGGSRVLAVAPYAFDVSLGNIFMSLTSGACLCIPSSWECKNALAGIVDNYSATHVQTTPSVSKMIQPSESRTLQVLDLCGEPCTEDALARWRASGARVMNTYGPAECTVTSVVNEDVLSSSKPSIIGRGTCTTWLVDPVDINRLSPVGAIGELVLEGPQIGAGYLHDSDMAHRAYCESPRWLLEGYPGVSQGRNGRLYRTGDLVRYNDEGQIEYIGRQDHQVKIRGQRIELGEIAVHLQGLIPQSIKWHPEAIKWNNGAHILVVFLVPPACDEGRRHEFLRSTAEKVQSELRKNLPPAMVPGAYASIKAIPLSLTGKTDRRKLKQIALSLTSNQLIFPTSVEARSGLDQPAAFSSNSSLHRGATTDNAQGAIVADDGLHSKLELLKSLWSDVLGVERESISPSDTFFSHGGESLKAIQLVGAASKRGVQLDVSTIFKHPQLLELSSLCRLTSASHHEPSGPFSLLHSEEVVPSLAAACGTTTQNIEDVYPCTPMQEGLIGAASQRTAAYIGRGTLKLPDGIDPARFALAWRRVVAVHPILRTRIVDTESHGLLQVVLKEDVPHVKSGTHSVAEYITQDEAKMMGLGTQLCRWSLVQEAMATHFVLTMHHAVYDGWSLPRIGAEVFRAYQGVRLQPAVGFNVFIQHSQSLSAKPAREYWAQQFSQPSQTTFFPSIQLEAQPVSANSECSISFAVPTNANPDISVPTLLRAAWALLVSKLSAADDITFGATVSGRNVPVLGIDGLLSPTISTIPVRVRLTGTELVESFVARVQDEALEAMPFENMGLQNIRSINPDTRAGTRFQTLFIVHPPHASVLDAEPDTGPAEAGLKRALEDLDISGTLSKFNEYGLMIIITQSPGGLTVRASFDSRVLDESQVVTLLDQFAHTVSQLGLKDNLKSSVGSLGLASTNDLEKIWAWNSTPFEGNAACIHDLIARSIDRQPQAQAICAWDGKVSYSELDKLSSRLAEALRRRGVRQGSLVPICMEKSKWTTIAMLAIMRAGASFIAMDVRQQPLQRLKTIVEEVKADWVVTAGPAAVIARKISKGVITCDHLFRDEVPLTPITPAATPPSPSDTAFLVFTSGSTGIPKGIIITHENFCTTVHHHEKILRLSSNSRIYDYASYSFDIAVHNALMALTLGCCLCVPSEDDRENNIEGSMERLGANWADLTPSVARLIDPLMVAGLKTLVLSGEVMSKDLILQWGARVELINAYGPAETQICTVQGALCVPDDASKIGRGVGCSTWIIDPANGNLAPIGALGELVIEGPIISPGYLNAPTYSFIRDPFWLLKGSDLVSGRQGTLYRTGDLARYQSDGTVLFAGRANTQTKINGQRVELGEIEYHLRHTLATVRDVVADVLSVDGIRLICAFLLQDSPSRSLTDLKSGAAGQDLSLELATQPVGLEDKLKRVMPGYMIPTTFFNISQIPLTPTRKVDRRRIVQAAAQFSRNDIISFYGQGPAKEERPAFNKMQQRMANVWSQVLKLEPFSITPTCDFFQLGGNSISAMRLVKSSRSQGLVFSVADVFRHSRFNELAVIASKGAEEDSKQSRFSQVQPFALVSEKDKNKFILSAATACDVVPDDVLDVYPCTPFQEGVFAQTADEPLAYVQHTELKFGSGVDLEQVISAWNSVFASNAILRTRIIQSEQAHLLQVVLRGSIDWCWYNSSAEYLDEAVNAPMWLGSPLSRFGLVRRGSNSSPKYTIIWSIHHALYDSWSIGLILQQVSSYYDTQKDHETGPDFSSYVRFLRHQRKESEKWWQTNLSGATEAAVFPKAPLTAKDSKSTRTLQRRLSLPETCPPGYTTAILLRAAWAVLMARHTGGDSVLFGEIRLGRNIPIHGIESMRGPTIASVPVLVHIDREQAIRSFLQGVRETSLQMQEFEQLGLQNIAKLNEETKAACNFQTLLVLQESEPATNSKDLIFEIDDTIDDIRNFNSWDLMIVFHQNSDGFVAEAVFRQSAISPELVDLLLQQTESILERLCVLPTTTALRQLDIAGDEDLSKIWEWNATPPAIVDEFLHVLVQKQARKSPERLAVLAHDGQLTYEQLDRYSSNIASQLLSHGVETKCVIPLCFEKSVWVPVAMLAVIKTGAAFSIMDVSYPEDRLEAISTSLEAQIILASPAQEVLAGRLVNNVFMIDENSCANTDMIPASQLTEPLPHHTDRLMYVCFTSGSTGVPKGVMVTHKNLASAGVAQTQGLGFGPEDRVYDFSSHAFDANIWHTWWALILGACLCIPSQEDRLTNLAGSISAFSSTALFLTPSVARTLDPMELSTVKRLYLGGEAVTPLDIAMWKDNLELWGAYGPTETTPLCIFTRLQSPECASNIGRGIGVTSWICNPANYHELMAVGAVGELVNEGPLVALGYRGLPEKTAAVFIEDPQFLMQGSNSRKGRHGRLYRTGDLVRYAFNGTIEYLGRADTQVKLRGQRVEFGEIEYHLKNSLPQAYAVICEVITHSSGRPMLVSFCASSPGTLALDTAAARVYLGKRLPPYMVPESFFEIAEIPKNPSGKVDRQKLRALGPRLLQDSCSSDKLSSSKHLHGPFTETETLLAKLWATALNDAALVVASDSDFFNAGADSIAAMKLSNLARKHDLGLRMKDIVQSPDLVSMALASKGPCNSTPSAKPFAFIQPSQLDQLLNTAASVCRISIESIADIYPCTPLQLELFALTLKHPEAYMRRSVFEVPAKLQLEKLIQAWNTVVDANPILRTRLVDVEGSGFLQVVVKGHQWSAYDSLPAYFSSVSVNPDLGSPLSHLAVISDKDSPKIVWTVHHALYDAWSTQIIEDQLRQAYQSQLVLRAPEFSSFVQHILSQDEEAAKQFWRSRLSGCASAPVYPNLPSRSYEVRPSKTFKRTLETSVGASGRLQATIHAAWSLIVSKLTETDDIVFAATLSGRDASIDGIERIVGPTIAPVPIRVQITDQAQSALSFVANIERDTKSMGPYKHFGTKNIELINADTKAACNFQTLIVVSPPDMETGDVEDISTSSYDIEAENQEAFHTFGLVLFFIPTKDGIALEAIFDPLLFDQREIERLSGRLESVMSALSQCHTDKILLSDIECLGKADLEDIFAWNSTLYESQQQLLHDCVLNCVGSMPDKVAIEAWDGDFSYSQVDQLSENLAGKLRKQGVGRGSVIPILALKSGYVPVAALAVLKSGGAFLPLDAAQPLQRLQAIVEQVTPRVILAAQESREAVIALGCTFMAIEECLTPLSMFVCPFERLPPPQPEDTACILFTSGTTGTPKGVMQSHRALSSAIVHQAAQSGFAESTRAFEFASYGFDVSWNMIFKVLAVGGTLCVPSEEDRKNDLTGALNRSAATLTELTPSVARLIDPDRLPALETLVMSGEAIDLRDFEHWTPGVRIIVCYGPSECTSVSTINAGRQEDSAGCGIGKAVSCTVWLVDPQNHRRLMPVGAVGEILIQGPIVGKGYYNNETLTSTSYVSDMPWLGDNYENGRFSVGFKSGDLARYDSRGSLHFISRKDTQIKINGQRIELEEVQHHVLRALGDLIGSVVCCVLGEPNKGSGSVLVAFLSTQSARSGDACDLTTPTASALTALETLNDTLKTCLPSYMVPAAYYFVVTIPRTSNGKVDRKNLTKAAAKAKPDQVYRGRATTPSVRRRPSTKAENVMQRLWAVALGSPMDKIGADDSFLDLNGDSISAMKLVAAARSEGYELRVSDVFANLVLSQLALKIQPKSTQEQPTSDDKPFGLLGDAVDLTGLRMEVARKCNLQDLSLIEDVYPCTPLQESMVAATIKDPGAFISMRLYRISRYADLERYQAAWATIVARNRILRTRLVDLIGHGLNQAVVNGQVPWETYHSMTSFLEDAKKEQMGLGSPLTRWVLIKEPHETRLVWIVHHTVYDGWSLQLIEDEVNKAYQGLYLPAPQPDMRPLVKYLKTQSTAMCTEFWKHELEDAYEGAIFPSLPYHNYAPRPNQYLQKSISLDLSELPAGLNLSSLLYGSWALLVSRITNSTKVTFGAILTGRNAPIDKVDKLMGPAITTVPILVDVSSKTPIQNFTNLLRNKSAGMIPYEHFGVSAIRRINSSCAAACAFQTVLVIQPPQEPRVPQDDNEEKQIMEELDETLIDGYPNQHTVLNQYGLMIEILPNGQATTIRANFDSGLQSELQVERILAQWQHITEAIINQLSQAPLTPLESTEILCQKDRDDIWQWNGDFPETINCELVHQTVSANARSRPEALAIDAWDGSLTYEELDSLSSLLARRLALSGIGRGCFVPLIFEKSLWANVSMLAVLKAGGSFVPFDADHPEGRLRAVMQLLNAEVILCSAHTRDRAARLAPCAMMVDTSLKLDELETSLNSASDLSAFNLLPPQANDIAYAVFTSGSTGEAKGVKISHANLATAIRHQAGAGGYQIDSKSRTLDSSFYAFDACVCNFFYTVTQGGCLCVPSEDSLRGDIGAFLNSYRINWAQLVPSVARTIDPDDFTELQTLVLTGEPITQGDIDTWSDKVRLINAYGPTECTILCAISSKIEISSKAGNIGQGRGANLWLTEIGNPDRLAPVGTVGEILIEGPIIGAGYLGPYKYPLVTNPQWLKTGPKDCRGRQGTFFRTGDQARYNEDGTLQFIGRIGSEMKLRGQRVDLMGVEDIVRRSIPSDLEVAADIVRIEVGDSGQDRQTLVVFVSGDPTDRTEAGDLSAELSQRLQALAPALKATLDDVLPSHQQPEALVPVPHIPKTSSAKTDRRRLKEIGKQVRLQQLVWIGRKATKISSAPPASPQEKTLVALWAKVLGTCSAAIGREDDFFTLGGDSLGVMRLSTAAHEQNLLLKARDIFETPSLADLAVKMTVLAGSAKEDTDYHPFSIVPEINDVQKFTSAFLEPALGVQAGQIEDIIPANGFQVDYMHNEEEPLGLQYAYLDIGDRISWPKLVDACRAVVQAFQCLRARFVEHDGIYYQVLLREAPLATEEIYTSEQTTTVCNRFCPSDGRQAAISDIYTKMTLVHASNSQRRVILRMSHMQNDGWCTIRILKTIASVYSGEPLEVTPAWTKLLTFRNQAAPESRKYWQSVLQGTTRITPALTFKPGGSKVRTLRTFALSNFHQSTDNRRTRPTVVINVAWALVLQQLVGHDDVVFGNVTTGRNGAMPGIESVIGPCVNMLPMRLRLSASVGSSRKQQLRALVEASAQQVDDRTAHEGLDWEDMVGKCTAWPRGARYASSVHFRNMAFEPELTLGGERVVVAWYELVATPHWTTVLAYPEENVLRLWLLANPAEIGEEGADELLHMLAGYVEEIVASIGDEEA